MTRKAYYKWTYNRLQQLADFMRHSDLPKVSDRLAEFASLKGISFGAVQQQYYRLMNKSTHKAQRVKSQQFPKYYKRYTKNQTK